MVRVSLSSTHTIVLLLHSLGQSNDKGSIYLAATVSVAHVALLVPTFKWVRIDNIIAKMKHFTLELFSLALARGRRPEPPPHFGTFPYTTTRI